MIDCPYNLCPTHENTFMINENPSKNMFNLASNFIVCPIWMVQKVQDHFLLDLVKYFQDLMGSGIFAPNFVSKNPIGKRYMDPKNYMYR